MSVELRENLVGLAIGLRYRKHFAIETFVGKMVDDILYSPKSFFNSDFFPNVDFVSPLGRRLSNSKTGNSLLIDLSDVILEIQFTSDFVSSNRGMVLDRYYNDILRHAVAETSLSSFERIGIIHKYEIEASTLDSGFPLGRSDAFYCQAQQVSVRIAKRLNGPASIGREKGGDYANAIVQIRRDESQKTVKLSADYQWYFLPPKGKVAEIKYSDFIQSTDAYLSDEVEGWVASFESGGDD